MVKSIKKLLSIAAAAVMCASAFSFSACGHTHEGGNPVKENEVAATCVAEGSYDEVVYCLDCNEEMSRTKKQIEIDTTAHVAGEAKREEEIEASCSLAGSYDEVTYCTLCEEELSRETKTVEKTDHKSGEPVIENKVESTCTEGGSYDEVIYCTDCKKELSRTPKTIEAAHKYSIENDLTKHWKKCDVCGNIGDEEAHVPGAEATETTAQTCTVCNFVLKVPAGHTHSFTHSPAKAVTCTEAGKIEYYSCSGCGKYFEDEAGEREIVNLNTTVIPATGHTFSKDWETDENFHWHAATCPHNDEKSLYGAHSYDDGKKVGEDMVYTCTVCGNTKSQHSVTFNMNMQGLENIVTYVNSGDRVAKPATPECAGFSFVSWYTDEECNTKYDFKKAVTGSMTLYASWRGTYVFEAEDTYLDDQEGKGFSNDAYGTDMIQSDYKGMAKASGGYFVGYMYNPGVTITFEIDSNKDDYNASLTLRLSGELVPEITLNNSKYLVEVNGNKVSYKDIVISGIDTDKSKYEKREFQDFNLGRVVLKKGRNVITLKVANSDALMGTMKATAPLLDCIKINTTAALTFEKTENKKP